MEKENFENNLKINFNSNNIFNIEENKVNETNIEESSIKNLIKEIYDLEKRLSKLNLQKENESSSEPKLKKLNSLKISKKSLENKISETKNELSFELKKNEISQEHKKVLLNELEQKIIDTKNKINIYNNNFQNFNSIQLIKYIYINKIINNTDYLSKQQIDNILIDKNNLSNNDEIKKILKEKEVNIISQKIIEKNILENNLIKSQYLENLKMLEEEKYCLLNEVSDILAYKENLEYGMKLFINNIITNNNNEEGLNEPLEILFNEIINIDSEKASNRICDEVYDLLILNPQKEYESINDKFFYSNHNNSFILNDESNNKRKDSFEFTKINNKSNNRCNKKSESSNVSKDKIREKNESIIDNATKRDEKDSLDKKMLKRLIQNEIDTFINTLKISEGNNKNNQYIDKDLINDFLFNLSMIISDKIKSILSKKDNNNQHFLFSSNNIIIYLSLFFKLFYYENLFDKNNSFINKDYTFIQKEINKIINEKEKEIIKLEEKLNEVKLKQKIDEALEQLIHKRNNANEESKYNNENLNKEEIMYIDISKDFNDLTEQREKIKNESEKNNCNFINKKKDIEIKIDEYNIQLNEINKEINEINKCLENSTSKNDDEIIKYKKIISDKFNKIKKELNSYKNKNQDNIDKYNNFLEKINTIMKSFNSSFSHIYNNNGYKDINGNNDLNEIKPIIDYNYDNNKYNTNNKKVKNGYFNYSKESYMNVDIKKLNKSMTIVKNKNISNPLYDNAYNNSNNSFLIKKQILNDSKKLDEETKSNINLPIKPKKQNIYNIYNISLLPNVINKNKSTTNIHAKIKEIKKLKSTKKIPISNKLYNSKNFSTIFSETQQQEKITPNSKVYKTNSFSQNKSSNDANTSKLIPLRNNIICYFRKVIIDENENSIKYNPLNNMDFEILCASPYNFIRAKMNLNENYNIINIKMYKDKRNFEIKTDEIENTVINSNIKKIIEIHRNYNKNKFKDNFSFEEFVNYEKNKFNEMSKEDIIKSALNQNFNFSLVNKDGKRFEFIIRSYEEFKIWINGLAFIIKNKNR